LVMADQRRTVQVMVNLLSNAIKFSPVGGEIEIDAESLESRLSQAGPQSGSIVEIVISDRGRGVPEDMRDRIFERFEQVKNTDATECGGSGLGLAICKSIVELHGGSIGVRDNPGGGSAFWLQLPAARTGD
ncbi:MAG TPA: ATP-binding protein, partial [Candidatus Melainabacteria bacterium]|nr:ATP-binding protein [Candidatus Melainabacteria bacterium]